MFIQSSVNNLKYGLFILHSNFSFILFKFYKLTLNYQSNNFVDKLNILNRLNI